MTKLTLMHAFISEQRDMFSLTGGGVVKIKPTKRMRLCININNVWPWKPVAKCKSFSRQPAMSFMFFSGFFSFKIIEYFLLHSALLSSNKTVPNYTKKLLKMWNWSAGLETSVRCWKPIVVVRAVYWAGVNGCGSRWKPKSWANKAERVQRGTAVLLSDNTYIYLAI